MVCGAAIGRAFSPRTFLCRLALYSIGESALAACVELRAIGRAKVLRRTLVPDHGVLSFITHLPFAPLVKETDSELFSGV